MQRVKNDTHRVHTSGMSLIYRLKKNHISKAGFDKRAPETPHSLDFTKEHIKKTNSYKLSPDPKMLHNEANSP